MHPILILILFALAFACFKGVQYIDKKQKQMEEGKMSQEELDKWANAGKKLEFTLEGASAVSSVVTGIASIGLVVFALSVLASLS